jgi:OmpA-OmpF porin, OOP family
MTSNILDLVKKEFNGGAVGRIADALGEDPTRTQQAVDGALPALLGGIADKASTTTGAADLISLLRNSKFDADRFTNLTGLLSGAGGLTSIIEAGKPLLASIFGNRVDALTDQVSSASGVKRSSISSLLAVVLPVLLGKLVSHVGWDPARLMGAVTGFRGLGADYTSAPRPAPAPAYVAEPARTGTAWWKWAIPLLALLAVGAYFLSRRQEPTEQALATMTPVPTAVPAATVAPLRADLGAFIDKKLPDGTTIHIPTNGVESKLLAFIEDPTRMADRETWFSFDRIEFDTDAATLRPSSAEQLRNIALVLKAYPGVNLKVGGYTDNTGTPDHNMKLSTDRATSTMQAIVENGIDKARLTAEGYAEAHPVADNSTEEGRQKNRRIDIRVTKK